MKSLRNEMRRYITEEWWRKQLKWRTSRKENEGNSESKSQLVKKSSQLVKKSPPSGKKKKTPWNDLQKAKEEW